MNKQLEEFARNQLKQNLAQCTDKQQLFFKRMYANGDLEMDINQVINNMSLKKLDWAMIQVQRTLDKIPK